MLLIFGQISFLWLISQKIENILQNGKK